MDFGSRLKELLNDRQLSQKDFAEDLSIAASTVGNYVRGIREPDYETLKRIASYFNISIDYLLGVQSNKTEDEKENELLLIFGNLTEPQRELWLEQGKLLMRHNRI